MNRDIDQTNVTVVGVRRLSRKAQFWWCVLDISTVGLSYPFHALAKRKTNNVRY